MKVVTEEAVAAAAEQCGQAASCVTAKEAAEQFRSSRGGKSSRNGQSAREAEKPRLKDKRAVRKPEKRNWRSWPPEALPHLWGH